MKQQTPPSPPPPAMRLAKRLLRPVEEALLSPEWLLMGTGRSSGPVNPSLVGKKQESRLHPLESHLRSQGVMNLELFFQRWRRLSTDLHSHSPAPQLCFVRNDTHFREGWPGEEFSPRPRAERRSLTLAESMSHGAELQPAQAGRVPSLILLKMQ